MNSLDSIFIKHGTDKGSSHPVYGHNYSPHYERLFEPSRFDPLVMVEIGVGGGESVRSWLEYFQAPQFHLIGADIVKDTNDWNKPSETPDPRYHFIHLDQENETNLACFAASIGGPVGILVDDGAHTNTGIVRSFAALWPLIAPDGLYCVEDLGAGFTPGSVHIKPGAPAHADWLLATMAKMHMGTCEADWIYQSRELIVFHKPAVQACN